MAQTIQRDFTSSTFRVYTNDDVAGVELGGALKNVIALAAGVATGLSLGHNSSAALITRGIAEMTRLAVACGGRRQTLAGLSGVSDLVLTCTGSLSPTAPSASNSAAAASSPRSSPASTAR